VRDYRYRQDLWTNANNYQSDNLFSLRSWISDISKDKTARDSTSYGWMDGPTVESRPMPMRLPLLEKQNRLPFSNWEVNDFIVVVFGIAIELH
jgi:hypothetical protein